MQFSEKMKNKAKSLQKRLILPEGDDKRVLKAASLVVEQSLAKQVIILGNADDILKLAKEENICLRGIDIINPNTSDNLQKYANEYYNLRKHKGVSEDQALEKAKNPINFAALAVRLGDCDAFVAGANHPTSDILLAAFTIIKTLPGIKSGSSCFVMETPAKEFGANGSFIFSDCATIVNPTSEQLADIAYQSALSCKTFLEVEPNVALLSFSTKGSADTDETKKVVQAYNLCKNKYPDLKVEGELQLDSAIVPSVAKSKAPNSSLAGSANVLIFPDLQSGNIGYKLVQRLAKAQAYGPILQGFAKPISDLSRGCSVEDIVVTSAITLSQSAN